MQRKSGINQTSQKESNLALVIRAIYGDQQCSRVKLSDLTGLKQATITKIVNQLIEWGLVCETESMESSIGRKPIRLALNSENYLLMAVRINRNYLRVAIYDIMCKMYYFREEPIDAVFGAQASMKKLKAMIHDAMRSVVGVPLGIGVALPGPFDYKNQRITLMSGFPGWQHIDIKGELQSEFALPVYMDHDAICGALAELWHGDHRFTNNLLYICGDRGVGAGLILDGHIYRGRTGFAGEIGHASINFQGPVCECGNRGCLEMYCSTKALEQLYMNESFDLLAESNDNCEAITTRAIFQSVREGEPTACRVYEKAVSYLSFGVVSVINTLNPDVVIFADKIIEGGDLFIATARTTLKKYLMPDVYDNLIVDVSTLEGDPMLLGSSVLVLENLLLEPSASFGQMREESSEA